MTIQYTALEFELMTFGTRVSYHNHQIRTYETFIEKTFLLLLMDTSTHWQICAYYCCFGYVSHSTFTNLGTYRHVAEFFYL